MDTREAEQVLAALQALESQATCMMFIKTDLVAIITDLISKQSQAGFVGQALLAEKEQLHQQLVDEQAG